MGSLLLHGQAAHEEKTLINPRVRIGLKLRAPRDEVEMSQDALANEAGLARSYLREVETGSVTHAAASSIPSERAFVTCLRKLVSNRDSPVTLCHFHVINYTGNLSGRTYLFG